MASKNASRASRPGHVGGGGAIGLCCAASNALSNFGTRAKIAQRFRSRTAKTNRATTTNMARAGCSACAFACLCKFFHKYSLNFAINENYMNFCDNFITI